jgi:hypothetical protein
VSFQSLTEKIQKALPLKETTKLNLILKAFGIFKIPLILFVNPKAVELTDDRSEIRIPLNFRTRNHLGVMYFGALAIGAELSIALKAVEQILKSKQKIDFLFKDFSIQFLKRADGHVHFVSEDVRKVVDLIQKAKNSGERFEETFQGYAQVPSSSTPNERVISYKLTLSVRNRSS